MTNTEALNELRNIECEMSPENLYCDGEASRAQVAAKLKSLNARKAIATKALGRSPSTRELWGVLPIYDGVKKKHDEALD